MKQNTLASLDTQVTPKRDPQAAQRRALSLVQSLQPAIKAPSKPFVHLAAKGIGSTAFVADTIDAAREALSAFTTAGYNVTFAVWMSGRNLVPLLVQSTALD